MTPFVVLIPARLASSRLPDKPLADLAGLPATLVLTTENEVTRDEGEQFAVQPVGRHFTHLLQ